MASEINKNMSEKIKAFAAAEAGAGYNLSNSIPANWARTRLK